MRDQSEPISWLCRVLSDSLITAETAAWAAFAWGQVQGMTDFRMPTPAACTGPDGEVFFGWDRWRYHLELEIVPDRAAEWFYRVRMVEETWLGYQGRGDPIPDRVFAVLGNFIDAAEAPRPTDTGGAEGP